MTLQWYHTTSHRNNVRIQLESNRQHPKMSYLRSSWHLRMVLYAVLIPCEEVLQMWDHSLHLYPLEVWLHPWLDILELLIAWPIGTSLSWEVYIPHWFMFVIFPKISKLQNISIQLTVQAMIDWNHITLAVNVGLPHTLPAPLPRTHTQRVSVIES